jgi:hypothetical protein
MAQIENHCDAGEDYEQRPGQQDASQQNSNLLALRIGRPGYAESLDEHLDQVLKEPKQKISLPCTFSS